MNAPHSMVLKVCGMRDLQNILALAAIGPDVIGLNFYASSPRVVDIRTLGPLRDLIPVDIALAGIFVNHPIEEIMETARIAGLQYIQLHGHEPPDDVTAIQSGGYRVIKAFHVTPGFDFEQTAEYRAADYYLFDTPSTGFGGSGRTFSWELLAGYRGATPYFLSGGIGPGHAAAIKSLNLPYPPVGLDINSRFETHPGVKDIDAITQFFKHFRS